jgi:hypothetical protein
MQKLAVIVGTLFFSGLSLILILAACLGSGGYPLVIENRNAAAVDLYFVTADGSPATSFSGFPQQIYRFPKFSVPSTATLKTHFDSSGALPVRAIVRRGEEFRICSMGTQTGGHLILPPTDTLPVASETEIAAIRQNIDVAGVVGVLAQLSIILFTGYLWFRLLKKGRPERQASGT